jgi:hypothetical protein
MPGTCRNPAVRHAALRLGARLLATSLLATSLLVTMPVGPASASDLPAAERAVLARLNQPVTVHYQSTPLDAALHDLRARTGLNFDIRWPRLEEAGVARDAPIDLQLRGVPAGVVLRRVLAQVSNEFDPIGYDIHAGIVTTSTQRELDRRMVTRVYDVAGLLMPIRDFDNAPELDLNGLLDRTGNDAGGGDLFNDDDDEPTQTRAERVQRLIQLIRTMIIEPS